MQWGAPLAEQELPGLLIEDYFGPGRNLRCVVGKVTAAPTVWYPFSETMVRSHATPFGHPQQVPVPASLGDFSSNNLKALKKWSGNDVHAFFAANGFPEPVLAWLLKEGVDGETVACGEDAIARELRRSGLPLSVRVRIDHALVWLRMTESPVTMLLANSVGKKFARCFIAGNGVGGGVVEMRAVEVVGFECAAENSWRTDAVTIFNIAFVAPSVIVHQPVKVKNMSFSQLRDLSADEFVRETLLRSLHEELARGADAIHTGTAPLRMTMVLPERRMHIVPADDSVRWSPALHKLFAPAHRVAIEQLLLLRRRPDHPLRRFDIGLLRHLIHFVAPVVEPIPLILPSKDVTADVVNAPPDWPRDLFPDK